MQRHHISATASLTLSVCIVFIFLMNGCGRSSGLEATDAGKTLSYVPGMPNFDIETVTALEGDSYGIDLFLNIPALSLTFEKSPSGFTAIDEFTARVRNRTNGAVVLDRTWFDTTSVDTYEMTQRSEPFSVMKHVSVPPGTYVVESSLEDRSTRKSTRHAQSIVVPALDRLQPDLSKILIQSRHPDGRFTPVVTFHIPSGLDSLRALVNIVNVAPGSRIVVQAFVLRFNSDTAAALPPYAYTALPLPVGYRQIVFENPDTIWTDLRTLVPDQSSILAPFSISSLKPGIYIIDVRAKLRAYGATADTVLGTWRYFSIRGRTFPRPSTLDELVEAMRYIATDKEMKYLHASRTPEEKRLRFDSLWISFAHDPQAAANLIKKYYTRVEDANRLFTTTKEGWKTDHGLLYVVLGPPIEVTSRLDTETWYYSLSGGSSDDQFIFKRLTASNENLSFENYFLYRSGLYERIWDRIVAKWRSGEGY